MTTGGWIFMIFSWGVILALVVYAYAKTLTSNRHGKNEKH